MTVDAAEVERFHALKDRLPGIWSALGNDSDYAHTSVIVPSLSVNQEELGKILGASFYEERLLFALIRLRNPNARVVYVTSQPLHPDIVEYYLDLLEGVPTRHARQRLHTLSVWDGSPRPLSEKVLERPRLVCRIRDLIRYRPEDVEKYLANQSQDRWAERTGSERKVASIR